MAGAILFGALIGRNAARTTRPAWQVGARTGSFLAVALILFELTVGQTSASAGVTALWLTAVTVGWGWPWGASCSARCRHEYEMAQPSSLSKRLPCKQARHDMW
ncbi:MAG: hypothetical protein HZY76_05065 [Anaerolineae bacterium]|nr:MAG: hypothetical protein HZY76_05065 [Anaerolineae bacterium]